MDFVEITIVFTEYMLAIIFGLLCHVIFRAFGIESYKNKVFTSTCILILVFIVNLLFDSNIIKINELFKESDHILIFNNSLKTILGLSFAFFIVSYLNYFVWNKLLVVDGITIVPKILSGFVNVLIYTFAIAIIISKVYNQSITSILAASGAIAFILGYSSQATVGQIISGFALNLGRNIRKGDYIRLDDQYGIVNELTWRSVTLKTAMSSTIVIPNNNFCNGVFENFANSTGRTVSAYVYVPCEIPPAKVIEILKLAASDCPNISTYSEDDETRVKNIRVFCLGFDEKGAKYAVAVNTFSLSNWSIKNDIYLSIWYHFKRENIRINHIPTKYVTEPPRFYDEEIPKPETVKEKLINCPTLGILNEDEIELISKNTLVHRHGPPERIMIFNSENKYLYFVHSGTLASSEKQEDGTTIQMRTFGPGDLFGIKSMLTGCKARITVRAITECIIYKIDRVVFKEILRKRPELFDQLSHLLMRRELENATIL